MPLLAWLSWLEHCPVNQKVTGLIPGQGTYLGGGFSSGQGGTEREPIDVSLPHHVSLPLFLPPFPSL